MTGSNNGWCQKYLELNQALIPLDPKETLVFGSHHTYALDDADRASMCIYIDKNPIGFVVDAYMDAGSGERGIRCIHGHGGLVCVRMQLRRTDQTSLILLIRPSSSLPFLPLLFLFFRLVSCLPHPSRFFSKIH